MLIARQAILLALSLAGAWLWVAVLEDDIAGPPLWIPGILVWAAQSMFWLGWWESRTKLLLYLAGAWVGVMASVAVMATFIGGGVAASGDQTAIRIALAVILFVPVLLLPRLKVLWPGGALPASPAVHAARSLFVLLQYGGVGLLMLSLIPVVTCVTCD
ncbi:MAG: hypothetical protein ACMVY4_08055 [Minwuia sp.]|uniref:hypothetical protein n=1 Tax=Minwuia sp. TaxID=2493630 RepID=UPI003A859D5C